MRKCFHHTACRQYSLDPWGFRLDWIQGMLSLPGTERLQFCASNVPSLELRAQSSPWEALGLNFVEGWSPTNLVLRTRGSKPACLELSVVLPGTAWAV